MFIKCSYTLTESLNGFWLKEKISDKHMAEELYNYMNNISV